MRDMLSLSHVSVSYGPIVAARDVSFEVRQGEIALLAGSNGAGKSTILRAISGLVPLQGGTIRFRGNEISGWPADRIALAGLRHVPEGRRVWATLTVREHLDLAWHRLPSRRRRELHDLITTLFPRLAERWHQHAGRMSGGEQQMLAIARGLAGDPALLMIDELSLGLAPAVVKQLFAALRRINERGVTLLLVEQALHQALQFAHRGFVLDTGRLVVEGTAEELRNNEAVRKAYLTI